MPSTLLAEIDNIIVDTNSFLYEKREALDSFR
jgi:hypothetical protein